MILRSESPDVAMGVQQTAYGAIDIDRGDTLVPLNVVARGTGNAWRGTNVWKHEGLAEVVFAKQIQIDGAILNTPDEKRTYAQRQQLIAYEQLKEEYNALLPLEANPQASVPKVFGVNNTTLEDGSQLRTLVMENLRGFDLATMMNGGRIFTEGEVIGYMKTVLETLIVAHNIPDGAILNRDIKPDNLFLCDDGRLVVTDWGLGTNIFDYAKMHFLEKEWGTPEYAAPEQLVYASVFDLIDGRADLYALGATFYVLLTGEVSRTISESHEKFLYSPEYFRRVVENLNNKLINGKHISPKAIQVILKAMQPDKMNRYQSAEEMLADLLAA